MDNKSLTEFSFVYLAAPVYTMFYLIPCYSGQIKFHLNIQFTGQLSYL